MPGEKVKRSISLFHFSQEILCPVTSAGNGGAADFKVREALFKVLRGCFVKVEILRLCTAPAAFVCAVVAVKVRLVPYFPVGHVVIESVCPALGIVADNMLTDNRPFFGIGRRNRTVLFYLMLNSLSETEKGFCACFKADENCLIGAFKIV